MVKEINNIEDLEYNSFDLMRSLTKKFIKTLDIMKESISNGTYILNINKNLLDSHIYIILELCETLKLEWNAQIKLSTYNAKNQYYIFSNDYKETLNVIEKIKFYTEFQTKLCIKGRA